MEADAGAGHEVASREPLARDRAQRLSCPQVAPRGAGVRALGSGTASPALGPRLRPALRPQARRVLGAAPQADIRVLAVAPPLLPAPPAVVRAALAPGLRLRLAPHASVLSDQKVSACHCWPPGWVPGQSPCRLPGCGLNASSATYWLVTLSCC